ncbi:insulinase family protein [bacterium]|nr:insulinase family protein [bacterium]
MEKNFTNLSNGIDFGYEKNLNTPRFTLCLNFAFDSSEKLPGVYLLIARLLKQGTKNLNSEQLAQELDKYAIDLCVDLKQDYLRFSITALNEDFEKALEIMDDVIKNSTFEEFEKEVTKIKGELTAKLDDARTKAIDNFYKTIYKSHFYGNTSSLILENLEKISKQDVVETYNKLLKDSKKVCAFVGDMDFDFVKNKLETRFGELSNKDKFDYSINTPILSGAETIEEVKNGLNQAHILRGWITPNYRSDDYAALMLLNIILGGSGLSSRLFLELREKKGLAYVVRSGYESFSLCGNFFIYIATEPKNIEISLKGFEEEIRKIKDIEISEEELENAKNNLLGKFAFSLETNLRQAYSFSNYAINGLGFDFKDEFFEKVKQVTVKEIKDCANKYFTDVYVTSILRP